MTDTSGSLPTPDAPTASEVITAQPTTDADDAPKQPRRLWDIVLSIVLMVLGAVVVVLTIFPSLFLPMATAGCAATTCNEAQMTLGLASAFLSPIIVMLVSSVLAIVLLVRRKLAFWVVLLGIVLTLVAWVFSIYLFFSAVPNFEAPNIVELLGTFSQQ